MTRREHRERANNERAPLPKGKAPARRDVKKPPRLDATHVAGLTSLMNPINMTQGLNLDGAEEDVMGRDPPQNARKHAARDPVELFTKELEELSRDLGIELGDDGFGTGPAADAEDEPEKTATRPRIPTSSSRGPASSSQIGALIEDLGLGGESGHKTRASGADKKRGHRRSDRHGRHSDATNSEESSERGSNYGSEDGSRNDRGGETGSETGSESGTESGSSYGSDSQSGSEYSGSETESGSGSERTRSGTDYDSDASEYSRSSRGSKSSEGSAASGSTGASRDSGSASSRSSADRRHRRGRSRKNRETADESVDRVLAKFEKDFGLDTRGWQKDRTRHIHKPEVSGGRHGADSSRAPEMTEEQQRRAHINSVVADMRKETRTTFGVEKERIQDEKATKLEQIAQLKLVLEEEGYKCDKVGSPTLESSMEEIDGVLAVLRLRNDRNRYSSLAEEIFVGGAEMLETVCDGTRAMPIIGWKPDYTGYSQTVAVKLHRMRFETAQVVGTIIEKFRIGSVARIVLELLPSIFLYPRQQKRQRGTPGLYDDPKIADARGAVTAIRASDDRKKSLHEVSNI